MCHIIMTSCPGIDIGTFMVMKMELRDYEYRAFGFFWLLLPTPLPTCMFCISLVLWFFSNISSSAAFVSYELRIISMIATYRKIQLLLLFRRPV